MFLTEDPGEIQDEVMAQIKSALNMNQVGQTTPTGENVSVPNMAFSPDSAPYQLEEVDESLEEEGSPCEALVDTKTGPSPTRIRTSSSTGESSTMNDSFVDRMNLSICSSVGGSSTGTIDSKKYYIGSVSEDECSVQSHVSNLGTEEMDQSELMEVVHTLYKELRKTDAALSKEKKRRHSREKSLIKLAKELKKRKDITTKVALKLQEIQEELRGAQSEKALLEHRLTVHKQASSEVRAAFQKQVDLETRAIKEKYEVVIVNHDRRIHEINDTHAKQCEQLCREVVDANQEVMRLQRVLQELSLSRPLDYNINTGAMATAPAASIPRSRIMHILIPFLILLFGLFLGPHLHPVPPMRLVTSEFEAYFGQWLRPNVAPKMLDISSVEENFVVKNLKRILPQMRHGDVE